MKVLVVRYGKEPEKVNLSGDVKEQVKQIQEVVGGYFEVHYPPEVEFGLFLNGDGKFIKECKPQLQLMYNGEPYDIAFGDYVVINKYTDGDGNGLDLTEEQEKEFMKYWEENRVW